MNYPQTIAYLFSRLPMFSRMGAAAYKPDLDNTIALCRALKDPQHRFRSIHIAGTNGKGSVSHMLAAILQQAGYRTGLYTSPHLKDFRERMKINGEMIPEQAVVDFTASIQPLVEEINPSFFEITVAMAFDWFANSQVDIAVIETGLGGRLDSTNIIRPELSVITNIGWDHMNLLGDSLARIAEEKAGIIKEGIPVVLGDSVPETAPVFENAAARNRTTLHVASEKRQVTDWYWENQMLLAEIAEEHHTGHKKYMLDLPGLYQTRNLLTVLEACSVLEGLGWKINDTIIRNALQQVRKLTGLHGRWEFIHFHPSVVLDVAHNQDGMAQLVQQAELTDHRELHFVIGFVKDKEIDKILSLLPRHARYYFTEAKIPRALPAAELAAKALAAGLKGDPIPDVNQALRSAMQHAHPDDLVIVCGSVFVVGEVNPVHAKV